MADMKRCVLLGIILALIISVVSSASTTPVKGAYYTDKSRTPNVYYEYREGSSGLGWYWKFVGYADSTYKFSNFPEGATRGWINSGSKVKEGASETFKEVHTHVSEESDIGNLIGLPSRNIIGKGVDVDVEPEAKEIRIAFSEDNSFLNFNGALFENIISQEESELPTYVYLDLSADKIIKADFSVNEKGGDYNFNGEIVSVPGFSRIIFNEEGINIKFPDGVDLRKFSDFFEQVKKGYINKIEGKNLQLPNGVILDGELYFEDGQAILKKGDVHMKINNIQIGKRKADFLIFFDGEEHLSVPEEEGYISLGEDKLVVRNANAEKWQFINFLENNPYVKVDEGDIFSLDLAKGSEAIIQNRDLEGLIPKVFVSGFAQIEEDSKSVVYESLNSPLYSGLLEPNKIHLIPTKNLVEEYYSTSPVELFIEKGTESVEDPTKGTKIIVDNSNRFAFDVPENAEEFSTIPKDDEPANVFFSSRLNYNYITEKDIEKMMNHQVIFDEGENKEFPVEQGQKDAILMRLKDYYQTLTLEIQQLIKDIEFSNEEKFFLDYFYPSRIAYTSYDKDVFFKSNPSSFNLGVFRHELAHVRHIELEEVYKKPLLKEFNEKKVKYYELTDKLKMKRYRNSLEKSQVEAQLSELASELDDLNLEISEFSSKVLFFKKWKDIAGDIYGKISRLVKTPEGEVYWVYTDAPLSLVNSPRHGVVNAYGGSEIREDVATFTEKASTNPSLFSCLIKIGCRDYDAKYRKKLDLLHEYKFISQEEYDAVLEAAGVR